MDRHVDGERERQRRETFREDDFRFAAAHEAGHAIVLEAVAPGSVEHLRVWADGAGFSGEVIHGELRKGSWEAALVAVAGEVGERLFAGGNRDWRKWQYEQGQRPRVEHDVVIRRSDGDQAKIDAYIGFRFGHEYRKMRLRELQAEARRILLENETAFINLVTGLIDARCGMGGVGMGRAQVMAAIEGRTVAPAPKPAGASGKRAAVTGGQEMTLQEKIEVRDQAIKAGNDYLARILTQNIEWHQGKRARTGAGPMETAALGNAARRGNRQGR